MAHFKRVQAQAAPEALDTMISLNTLHGRDIRLPEQFQPILFIQCSLNLKAERVYRVGDRLLLHLHERCNLKC